QLTSDLDARVVAAADDGRVVPGGIELDDLLEDPELHEVLRVVVVDVLWRAAQVDHIDRCARGRVRDQGFPDDLVVDRGAKRIDECDPPVHGRGAPRHGPGAGPGRRRDCTDPDEAWKWR